VVKYADRHMKNIVKGRRGEHENTGEREGARTAPNPFAPLRFTLYNPSLFLFCPSCIIIRI
jgi:hypothetical protein